MHRIKKKGEELMKNIYMLSLSLSIVACLNYGFLAVFKTNILQNLLANFPIVLQCLYFLFGVSAFINITLLHKKIE